MGGRLGYYGRDRDHGDVLSWFGIISVLLALVPVGRDLADPALHRHC